MAPRRDIPLRLFLPNLVTILGLCSGLTAIRYAMVGRFDIAVALVMLAAVADAVDGLLARRLGATSSMGAEIDSLSDFACFGVAPGIIVYQFALADAQGVGWVFALVYIVCACLRLARFNVTRDDPLPPTATAHFIGVPAPGGAMIALLPVAVHQAGWSMEFGVPLLAGLWIIGVGLLMISRVPTPALKGLRIPRGSARYILVGAAFVIGIGFTRFWLTLSLVMACYIAVIGWAVVVYLRRRLS